MMLNGLSPLLALLLPLNSLALDVTEVSVKWQHFHKSARHPMILPPERPAEKISLNLNINLFWCVNWTNTVHGTSTDRQFRAVGWNFTLNARPFDWFEIGLEHHSRHNLDQSNPLFPFPVEDSLYIKLIFIGPGSPWSGQQSATD